MNYFQINLNKLEDKSVLVRRARRERLRLALLVITLVGLTAWYVTFTARLGEKRREFEGVIDNLTVQLTSLQQAEQFISEADVADLHQLTQERIFWTEKLEILAEVVDTTIALTGFVYDDAKLVLRGITRVDKRSNSFPQISLFIDTLKQREEFTRDFPRIEFSSSDRITAKGQDIMSFEVVCFRQK
jgi:Tfp pilus assembly protein PilN